MLPETVVGLANGKRHGRLSDQSLNQILGNTSPLAATKGGLAPTCTSVLGSAKHSGTKRQAVLASITSWATLSVPPQLDAIGDWSHRMSHIPRTAEGDDKLGSLLTPRNGLPSRGSDHLLGGFGSAKSRVQLSV